MAVVLFAMLSLLLHPLGAAGSTTPTPSESFSHYTDLVPDGKFHLFWKFDKDSITFEVYVKTTGFVGLGVSPGGSMKGADIVVGWVKDGQTFLHDLYSPGNGQLQRDDSQDWKLISGKEANSFTVLKFRRKLVTCDKQDNAITQSTTRLIWSFNEEDPASDDVDALLKKGHGLNRGTKSMYLLNIPTANKPLPKDAFYIDFLNSNVTVPADRTTYWCQAFKTTKLGLLKKHHIVRVEPIITKGMESVTHHILLYVCDKTLADSVHGVSYNCYQRNKKGVSGLGELMECSGVTLGWAVGGQNQDMPDDVGLPIGGPEDPGVYRMETHYDNPMRKSGMIDASGLRVWVTPTPRKYEGGMIQTGVAVSREHILPPSFPALQTYGHCTKQCLKEALAQTPGGVTVFGAFLHAHLAGIAISVRHYREGVELAPLTTDDTYDFNFQDFRLFERPSKVLPGDSLVVQCTYTSVTRAQLTTGGPETRDEMCLSFLMYYPKIKLTHCESVPTFAQTFKFIGGKINYKTYTLTEPAQYAGKRLDKVLASINWHDQKMRDKFQEAVGNGTFRTVCRRSSETEWPSHRQVITVPEIKRHLKAPPSICDGQKPPQLKRTTTPKFVAMATKAGGNLSLNILIVLTLLFFVK